jgi:hypothetical protein
MLKVPPPDLHPPRTGAFFSPSDCVYYFIILGLLPQERNILKRAKTLPYTPDPSILCCTNTPTTSGISTNL